MFNNNNVADGKASADKLHNSWAKKYILWGLLSNCIDQSIIRVVCMSAAARGSAYCDSVIL